MLLIEQVQHTLLIIFGLTYFSISITNVKSLPTWFIVTVLLSFIIAATGSMGLLLWRIWT